VTVHDIVDSGSAFAMTEEGEMVFVNQRIVATVGLEPGGVYEAFLLPNYPDKREMIPWRALRVVVRGSEPLAKSKKAVDEQLLHAIVRLLNNDGYLTAAEIAETLDASLIEVHRTLKNTHGIVMSVPAYFVP
jgi:hypothetical protein